MPTKVQKSGKADIDGVLWGSKWDFTTLTYSMPQSASEYLANPFSGKPGYAAIQGFEAMNAQQAAAIHSIIRKFDDVCGLSFTFTADFSGGNIRFAEASGLSYNGETNNGKLKLPGGGTAEGNVPSGEYPNFAQGDTWYNNSAEGAAFYDDPRAGNFAYTAGFMHEIGHALGLKHGHFKKPADQFNDAFPTLPKDHNSQEYSVMTYARYVGDTPGKQPTFQTSEFPTTPMQADIAALQYLYGADWTTNSGDTVYTWSSKTGEMSLNGQGRGTPPANYIFLTIWDAGGRDTYDMANYASDLRIDLRPGASSKLSSNQLADLDGSAGKHVARGSVYNALQFKGDSRSLIENARGGKGDDTITGNSASNDLRGNGGRDRIVGGANDDDLWGGSGRDVFEFNRLSDSRASTSGRDTIFDFTKNDRIDLRSIDADTRHKGKQDFDWIGTKKFTGDEGDLRYEKKSSDTYIYADANGDKKADFAIHLDDAVTLKEGFFLI